MRPQRKKLAVAAAKRLMACRIEKLMRAADCRGLEQPFEAQNAEEADAKYCEALGVRVPSLQGLYDDIQADVDVTAGGVSWWVEHLDTHRRILITDHILAALHSVQENLAEAALHRLEYIEAVDQVSRRMSRFIRPDGSREMPAARCAADLLPHKLELLHAGGLFRAIGSALDCMAVVVIGVLGVPQDVLRADFQRTRLWLRSETKKAVQRYPIQLEFASALEDVIQSAGPDGWLGWADDYRNMFVHRGRRNAMSQLDVDAVIVGPDGRPIPNTTVRPLLLADPCVSTVEAWARLREGPMTLTEVAQDTLTELIRSTVFVSNACAERLRIAWSNRRTYPQLVRQPESQWPVVTLKRQSNFEGFRPNTVDVASRLVVTNTSTLRRLSSAGFDDDVALWGKIPTE